MSVADFSMNAFVGEWSAHLAAFVGGVDILNRLVWLLAVLGVYLILMGIFGRREWFRTLRAGVVTAALLLVAILASAYAYQSGQGLIYTFAALFGALTAAGELVSRYTDAPFAALRTRPGVNYLILNATVSISALFLLREVFPLELGEGTDGTARQVKQLLVAGFGSMTVLRSSVISVRAGDTDVPIGPAAVVKMFLDALDRGVDRNRAIPRAERVPEIMEGVSFARAVGPLTSMCMELMQNVKPEEEARLRERVTALANTADDRKDDDKAVELGLILANITGFEVLEKARAACGDDIDFSPIPRIEIITNLFHDLTFDEIKTDLPPLALITHGAVPDEKQRFMLEELNGLLDSSIGEKTKASMLGLTVAKYVGEVALEEAVVQWRKLNDKEPPPARAAPVSGSKPVT